MEIQRLTRSRAVDVTDALAYAMHHDPLFTWLFPDEPGRADLLPLILGDLVRQSLDTDRVLVDDSGRTASLWIRRGPATAHAEESDEEPTDEDRDLFAPYVERLTVFRREVGRHTPARPHLYLSVIATLPGARGRGVGGAMLAHRLADADLPVYLEATTERGRALYLRHGFEDTGDPVTLPDGPTLYPMLRPL
ncbi:GNAT family N-acetyltransferase [Nocardiopsis sp. MG754419]|uniref:GNAT family N-acetyltransferase n=1 Tax=Nocardiopsis sp. MG754419 TaxID=2259865 RepID=UPI001BAD9DF1|nr:GNAT family N-acetyltransferase [Nocardiopsis sp. MG754419]MBR8742613.1 GNAT family N-acetyltransferase [Nocardiopsis sp. MG754419]